MKIYFDMVGCRLNQAEIEMMACQFHACGHEVASSIKEADVVVINTCTVTSRAAADSRGKIRSAAIHGVKTILVTGCWSTLEGNEAAALPNVQMVVPNSHKEDLVSDFLQLPQPPWEHGIQIRQPLSGSRRRTRAFIKVQDGCNNHCTYCAAVLARGPARSLPEEHVVRNIQAALAGGVKEIVLTGVHTGSWGWEYGSDLCGLIRQILFSTEVPRLRLSSLEPWDLHDSFFDLWKDARMCRHVHLPLQSGSASVLRRMSRKCTPATYRTLIAAARAAVPDISITTDVLVGFPGETEQEFRETLEFIREITFSGGHVFPYSARIGTPAASMKDQVSHSLRHERSAMVRSLLQELKIEYQSKFIGRRLNVLWESCKKDDKNGWIMNGLSDNYLRVKANLPEPHINAMEWVGVTGRKDNDLYGIVHTIGE